MPIVVNVEELIQFIRACTNGFGDYESRYDACKVCPVRKECHYYYTKDGDGGALAGAKL